MDLNGLMKECSNNPLLCVLGIVLLLIVVQNCVMDIGLGDFLGMEGFTGFSNLLDDTPTISGPAPSPSGVASVETSASVD